MRILPAVLAIAFACTLNAAQPPPNASITDGFGVQLKGQNDTPGDLDAIRDLGLKYVRKGFHWEGVEKEAGVYNFTNLDRVVNDCKSRGLSVIGCLAFGNKLYNSEVTEAKPDRSSDVRTASGRAAFAKYAAAVAAHFKDAPVMFEIWNEPNTMTFWGNHGKKGNSDPYAAEYIELVKSATAAIHQANPKAKVLAGSVSGLWAESFKWQDFMFKRGALKTGFDYWSVHPYSPNLPENYIEAYGQVRQMMNDAGGPEIPLINSERGATTGKGGEGAIDGKLSEGFEYQAWLMVRQYLMDALLGVNVTIWYEWSGTEKFSMHDPTKTLPAEKACKVLTTQLQGFKIDKRIELTNPRDFALRLTSPDGGVKIVAWAAPEKGMPLDKLVPHAVKIPVETTGELVTSDIYGKPGTVAVKDGAVEVTLTGAPQYVTVKGKK